MLETRLASLDTNYKNLQTLLDQQTRLLDAEVKKNEALWAQYEA